MNPFLVAHSAWCRAGGFSETTIKDRVELLIRVACDLGDLHTITGDHLAIWLGREGWSVQTRATYYSHLRGYYLWALRANHLARDPMLMLVRPKVPARAPRPAREALFARCLMELPDKWRIAAALAGYAGLRAAEISRARREDIDARDLVVTGKGGRSDVLPTHAPLWEIVRDLPIGLLVPRVDGGQYTPNAVSHAFGAAVRQHLHIPKLTLHNLRHRYGTVLHLAKEDGGAGATLRTTQTLMRHASPATTAIYTQVTDKERRRAIATLPAVA